MEKFSGIIKVKFFYINKKFYRKTAILKSKEKELIIRRNGLPPYNYDFFEFDQKNVEVHGELHGYFVIVDQIKEIF